MAFLLLQQLDFRELVAQFLDESNAGWDAVECDLGFFEDNESLGGLLTSRFKTLGPYVEGLPDRGLPGRLLKGCYTH